MPNEQGGVFARGADGSWVPAGTGVQRQILGHDEGIMLVRIRFDGGAVGAAHHHPHRQVSYVESGVFEVEVGGRREVLRAGDSFVVPPNVEHGVTALEPGTLIDAFAPRREDFLTP